MGYSANAPVQALYDEAPLVSACDRMADRMIDDLEREVRHRTPVAHPPPGVSRTQFAGARGRMPGTLKASWERTDVDRTVAPGGTPRFEGEAFTRDPIGPLVEHPTRPHLIRPRVDRAPASVTATGRPRRGGADPQAALRYVNAHGRVVYAREVHHPGTEGTHMMRDSIMEVEATWEARIGAEEMRRWAREQAELVR